MLLIFIHIFLDIPLRVMACQPLTEQLIPIYVSVNEDFGENLDAHLGEMYFLVWIKTIIII